MAFICRAINRNCYNLRNITKPVKLSTERSYYARNLTSGSCYQIDNTYRNLTKLKPLNYARPLRPYCTRSDETEKSQEPKAKKPGLVQRFKQMYRDYWYVLLPVHMATSTVWFGSFYYIVRSGVDILGLLESLGVSETVLAPLKDSSAGYFAIAFAIYKIATPLRYAVTVGGTTLAIRKLKAIGWIKPVPSRERIKEILQEKKDTLQDRFSESKQHYQTQMKEKSTQVMDEMRRYKTEMRNIKDKVKKM